LFHFIQISYDAIELRKPLPFVKNMNVLDRN
jgi:hypothetical protein